jgi:hypothetical protein
MDDQEVAQEKINEAYTLLKEPELPERLFYALEGISGILLAWMQMNGMPGWSSHLKNPDKTPFFTEEEQVIVENAARSADPYLRPLLSRNEATPQVGGAEPTPSAAKPPSTPISLDGIFYGTMDKISDIDMQFKDWQNNLGVVQRVSKVKAGIPQLKLVSTPLLITLVYSTLDFFRLAIGNPLTDLPSARIITSLILTMMDVLTGDWKNAILSFSGVMSANLNVLGFMLKVFNSSWQMIAPSLREKLLITGYQSSKSMVVGFLLWSFATFLPDDLRPSADVFFKGIADTADEVNKLTSQASAAAQQQLDAMGLPLTISFFKIQKDQLPTFEQIQNIQELLGNENIVCLQEFQTNVIDKIGNSSLALLLVFQLLNVPTDPQVLDRICKQKPRTLDALIAKAATPTIEEKQTGGKPKTKTRKRRAHRPRSSSTSTPAKR